MFLFSKGMTTHWLPPASAALLRLVLKRHEGENCLGFLFSRVRSTSILKEEAFLLEGERQPSALGSLGPRTITTSSLAAMKNKERSLVGNAPEQYF